MIDIKPETKYSKWISENVEKNCLGKCKETCEEMIKIFPELKIIKGFYNCSIWGPREHWWLVDEYGEIVDPTANQFPTKGNGVYNEILAEAPEPIGRCLNCGDYVYKGDHNFCSLECEHEVCAEINNKI